jgi:hypothetical protein
LRAWLQNVARAWHDWTCRLKVQSLPGEYWWGRVYRSRGTPPIASINSRRETALRLPHPTMIAWRYLSAALRHCTPSWVVTDHRATDLTLWGQPSANRMFKIRCSCQCKAANRPYHFKALFAKLYSHTEALLVICRLLLSLIHW